MPTRRSRPKLSLTEHAYTQLKTEILCSQLKPGSIVIEAEIAERFGFSKTPIREALRLLVQDGWIEVLPRRGYLVRPIGLDDLRQIYEFRGLIERSAVALAASAIDDNVIAALRSDIDDQAASGQSIERSIDASRRFHTRLARLTNNDRLIDTLESLLDEVERLLRMLPQLVHVMTSSEEIEAHTRFVEALERGDYSAGVGLLDSHLEDIGRTLLDALSGVGTQSPVSLISAAGLDADDLTQ
ncbi:MAG: GntR family transcriptional regulator [Acidimicrobiia bacterium]|nr:GntR family transcriptional regulator [Acidimicrobiia bacterium]